MVARNKHKQPSEIEIMKMIRDEIRLVNDALSGIHKVKPVVHKLRLSGKYIGPQIQAALKEKLGVNGIHNPDNMIELLKRRNFKHDKMGYISFPSGRKASIYYDDTFKNKFTENRHAQLECVYPSKRLLEEISAVMPDMTIRSIEYAIDFLCRGNLAASKVFWLLCKTMYFHNAKHVEFGGGNYYGYPNLDNADGLITDRNENALCVVKFGTSNKKFKIYERGPDKEKVLRNGFPCWNHNLVDRVRVELTIGRDSKMLGPGRRGPGTLSELLKGPCFKSIFFPESEIDPDRQKDIEPYPEIKFTHFIKSSKMPKYYEDYYIQGGKLAESFQLLYLYYKSVPINNIGQYVAEHPMLSPLKTQIKQALKDLDREFSRGDSEEIMRTRKLQRVVIRLKKTGKNKIVYI